jgi:ATP-dependent protease ClpP protease subunit
MTQPHNPIRCYAGDAQPYEPFWRVVDADATGGNPEIQFDGVISEFSWLGDEITPKKFKDDLYNLGKGGPVTLRLNSPGGDVIAASVIRSIITDYPGDVTVQIDGLAASAATVVAMSGKTIKMLDSAYMMIHDPAVVVMLAMLDISTLESLTEQLWSIKDGILNVYAARTNLGFSRLSNMMAKETWMSAQAAVDMGFADEVIAGGQKKQDQTFGFVNVLHGYQNVPAELLDLPSEQVSSPTDNEHARNVERLRERVNILTKE